MQIGVLDTAMRTLRNRKSMSSVGVEQKVIDG